MSSAPPPLRAQRLLDDVIAFEQPLVKESHRATLRKMVAKLQARAARQRAPRDRACSATAGECSPAPAWPQDKLANSYQGDFVLFRVLRAHVLPLTNCAFNKVRQQQSERAALRSSSERRAAPRCRAATGSSPAATTAPARCVARSSRRIASPLPGDRRGHGGVQIWDTHTGSEVHVLEGHKNVVYAIAFNSPYGDRARTRSPAQRSGHPVAARRGLSCAGRRLRRARLTRRPSCGTQTPARCVTR